MDRSLSRSPAARPDVVEEKPLAASDLGGEGAWPRLVSWPQQLLAVATSAAILVSGLNGFVQVWKVVLEHWKRGG